MQAITTIRFDEDAEKRRQEYEVWFRQMVLVGLDAVAKGEAVSHEEMKKSLRDMGVHVD